MLGLSFLKMPIVCYELTYILWNTRPTIGLGVGHISNNSQNAQKVIIKSPEIFRMFQLLFLSGKKNSKIFPISVHHRCKNLTPNVDKVIISLFSAQIFPCKHHESKSLVLVALCECGLKL